MEIEPWYLSRALHSSVGLADLWRQRVFTQNWIVLVCLFWLIGKKPCKASLGEMRKRRRSSRSVVEACWKPVNQWSKRPNHDQLQNALRLRKLTSPKRELLDLFLFIKCSHHIGFGTCCLMTFGENGIQNDLSYENDISTVSQNRKK